MVKAWHVILAVSFAIFISIIVALEAGAVLTPYYFLPLILVIIIVVILWLIYKLVFKKEMPSITGFRAKLTIESVKFAAATHLLNHHGIDLFATGYPTDPISARYVTNMIANKCSPVQGEEAWFVRLTLRDKRYFDGLYTRIIIYIDGDGNVTDDPIMNEKTFIDSTLWRHPEIWFTKAPSKTTRPRSLETILAQRFEETGELPPGITIKKPEKEE